MKLLGGGLLALAGALLGGSKTAELRAELRELRSLSASLGIFESELTALQTPLPEIFEKLKSERLFLLLSAGFGGEPTERLWRRAAETLEIDAECRRALSALGAVVGRYDAPRQAAEIAAVRARLNERAAVLEAEIAGRGRRLPGLGAALGAMAAALLF